MKTGVQEIQTQKLSLSQQMMASLRILNIGANELISIQETLFETNPFIEYAEPYRVCKSFSERYVSPVEYAANGSDSLYELLNKQLGLIKCPPIISEIGKYVIGCIDSNGYLTESVSDIARLLRIDEGPVKLALKYIQSFDPAGVGARSLRECLTLQLSRQNALTPCVRKTLACLLTGTASIAKLSKLSGYSQAEVSEALSLIKKLDPKPGAGCAAEAAASIIPEIQITIEGGQPKAALSEYIPRLTVGNYYGGSADSAERTQLSQLKREAVEFVSNVKRRYATLLLIVKEIIACQADFFLSGAPIRELKKIDIANALGLSPSTVGRAVFGKYLLFNDQSYPIEFFFSSDSINRADVKSALKSLIDAEDAASPHTDSELAVALSARGYVIAERTVGKYRDQLGIPSCKKRRLRF